jgi:hypothetical protein
MFSKHLHVSLHTCIVTDLDSDFVSSARLRLGLPAGPVSRPVCGFGLFGSASLCVA